MKIYLVGGAVRDGLLNIPVCDRDWVVVGATPSELLAINYQQVGKHFPVFIHPNTHEEYALARTEYKSGIGYTGFSCCATPDITLEEDLLRRDLTINAMASSSDGVLIDPYQGLADLQAHLLRHVSNAFTEDPLRVLRVARFSARFAHLGFSIAEETLELMRNMVHSGALMALKAERVWQETEKALQSQHPQVYFEVLRDCDALSVLFPEINALFGVPGVNKWHPESDMGVHTMMTLTIASQLSSAVTIRFSALCHDLGKGLTPKACWPEHKDHGLAGFQLVENLCQRLRIPNLVCNLAKLVAKYHDLIHMVYKLRASTLLKLLNDIDAWRKPERLEQIILTSEADMRGCNGFEDALYPQGNYLRQAYEVANKVSIKQVITSGVKGVAIHHEITRRRQQALDQWISSNTS